MALFRIFDKNFFLRTCSVIVLSIMVLAIILRAGAYLPIFILICAVLMAFEWQAMIGAKAHYMWKIIGLIYITLPTYSLMHLNNHLGPIHIIYLLIIVCSSDIGAYVFGRLVGGPKLVPAISPNKTWSGAIGGLAVSSTIGWFFYQSFLLYFIIAITAQFGDLFESWLKRRFGIKDSGNLIPGHGGLLDRVDSIVFAAPVYILLNGVL